MSVVFGGWDSPFLTSAPIVSLNYYLSLSYVVTVGAKVGSHCCLS